MDHHELLLTHSNEHACHLSIERPMKNHSTHRRYCLELFAKGKQSYRCQDGRVVKSARLKVISWLSNSNSARIWVFWSPGGGVGSNPTHGIFWLLSHQKQQSSLVVMPTCSPLQVQAVDATLLSPTSGSSICWRFPQKHSPLSQIQNNRAWDRVFLCNSKIPYEINVIWKKCYIWSACYIWNVIYESKIPVWTFLCSVLQRLAFSTVKCLFPLVR